MGCNHRRDLLWAQSGASAREAALSFGVFFLWVWRRADEREDDGQQDEAVGHAENHDAEESLEHDFEDVGLGASERDHGEESREATVDHTGAH